jgi:hypothetical protein
MTSQKKYLFFARGASLLTIFLKQILLTIDTCRQLNDAHCCSLEKQRDAFSYY